MKKYSSKFLVSGLICMCFFFSIKIASADITENRAKVVKMIKDGNFKEALDLAIINFKQVSDKQSSNDLKQITSCFQRLRKYDQKLSQSVR